VAVMALESHTIVRKRRGGPDGGRFVIRSEVVERQLFVFRPTGAEISSRRRGEMLP